jgi:TonB-linked SusC/RagA family outer membrane protein
MKGKLTMKSKLILPIGVLMLLFMFSFTAFAQNGTITGKVTDVKDGAPLAGANVIIQGTSLGGATDTNGDFKIGQVPAGTYKIEARFIGYASVIQDVTLSLGQTVTVNFQLKEDPLLLDAVVVVGYGTQKKSDLTGSIATVGTEDYELQPVTSLDQVLQGRTAGVNVTNSSGAPGGALSIRIRGANSINGVNDPLYVVDGFVGADFRDVNPSDIESIQVLKDASSTAIYGSRGANGVVLITTKGATPGILGIGKPRLSYTARSFSSQTLGTWDLMDAATFAEIANQRSIALGTNPPFTADEIANFRANGGTDWQDELLRTGTGQEHQLDYSGGTQNVNYFVSGNYLDQKGILINSYYKRYSIRTNFNANLTEKLDATLKLNYVRRENNNTLGGDRTDGPLGGTLAWAPTTPARDASGKLTVNDPISSIKANPIELALNDNIGENNSFNANGGFDYKILNGLKLNIGFGLSYINAQNKNFSSSSQNNNPNALRGSSESIFLQNTNTLNYTKVLNTIHQISVTGAVEHQVLRTDRFSTMATGLQFPDLMYNNITLAGSVSSQAYKDKQTIRSFIGRINYSLMDKYLLTVSIRSDGSSKFRDGNKYSTFPSVGLGWRVSEEPFMQRVGFFENLKLRGSWGQTGSQAIPVYGTVTTFSTSSDLAGTSFETGVLTPGIIIGNPGNPDLMWETTTQLDVGLDIAILNGRLGLEVDYFKKNTTDLLLSEPLPAYAGGGTIFRNLGEVENTGFEFSLNYWLINKKDFTWHSTLNSSFMKNEVLSIGDRERIFLDGDAGAGLTNQPEMILLPGHGLANYYGLKYLGVWQTSESAEAAVYGHVPGDSKFQDVNNDGAINADDFQIIGSAIPEALLGWNNTFSYKNFTLNVFFQAMLGFDKWNFTYAQSMLGSADARQMTHVDILDRWGPGNEDSDIPAFSETEKIEIQSSRFLEEGDFLRLKNLSLSYKLPDNLVKGVNGLSLSIGVMNLWTLTNYSGIDPEAYSNRGPGDARGADAGAYPNSRTWTFGINLIY